MPRKSQKSKAKPSKKQTNKQTKKKKRSVWGDSGNQLGSMLAAKAGLPPAIGGLLGSGAGKLFGRLFGKGDYVMGPETVTKNSVLMPSQANSVPLMHSDNGCVRVTHREFVDDIRTSVAPDQRRFIITPTNSALFPWLATFATSFEQYRLMGMVVEYVPTSGNSVSSTNAALGSVSIATQYNVNAPGFQSKRQILNHYFAVSGAPSHKIVHPIECKDMYDPYKMYWTRTGANPGSVNDERLSDYGELSIWTQGSQSIYTGGELWLTYDIVFYKPRLPRGLTQVVIDPFPYEIKEDPEIVVHIPQYIDPCDHCHHHRKDSSELPDFPPVLTRTGLNPDAQEFHPMAVDEIDGIAVAT